MKVIGIWKGVTGRRGANRPVPLLRLSVLPLGVHLMIDGFAGRRQGDLKNRSQLGVTRGANGIL